MLHIYKSLPRFKGESSINTWAYRIALNTCLKNYRIDKGIRFFSLDDFEAKLHFDENFEAQIDFKILLKYASSFNVLDRELIFLYLTGVEQNEISTVLGLSVSNVSTKISRLKENISAYMNKGMPNEQ